MPIMPQNANNSTQAISCLIRVFFTAAKIHFFLYDGEEYGKRNDMRHEINYQDPLRRFAFELWKTADLRFQIFF